MARNVSIERPRGWPLSPLSLAVRQGAGKRPWNVFIKIPELIIYAEQKHNEARFERKERWPSSTGSPRSLAFSFLISALFPSETFRNLNRPTRRYCFAYLRLSTAKIYVDQRLGDSREISNRRCQEFSPFNNF